MRWIFLVLAYFQIVFADQSVSLNNNQFAIDLYQSLGTGNVIYSPLSIYTSLSMLYVGADGVTKKTMEEVLKFDPKTNSNSARFGKIITDLNSKMMIANGLFVDENTPINRSFAWQLSSYFKATALKVPFERDPQSSIDKINKWVTVKTADTIKDLLSTNEIDKYTKLVLVNTLLLKKKFLAPFDKTNTNKEFFYPENLPSVKVSMMEKQSNFPYLENKDYQVLSLPLEDHFSLTFILPKAPASLSTIEKTLSVDFVKNLYLSLNQENVKVKLPSFTIEKSYNLNSSLSELGLHNLFSSEANFSKINGKDNLSLSQVQHKALFEINEDGILASAATAAVVSLTSARPQKADFQFTANHPFLFMITDKDNLILFLGKFEHPEK